AFRRRPRARVRPRGHDPGYGPRATGGTVRRLALVLLCWAAMVQAGDFTMPGSRGRIRPSPAPKAAQQVFGTNGDIAPNGSVAATTMFASFMGEDDREAAVQM